LHRQLARACGALSVRAGVRPAGSTLLFVRGRVLGADRDALVLEVVSEAGQAIALRMVAPSDHQELCYVENLRTLARAPGLPLLVIGRVVLDAPRTIAGLAIAPAADPEDGVKMHLPDDWGGRAMLGLDRLQGSHLSPAAPHPMLVGVADPSEAALDPLAAHRRRVQRLALGGVRCLSPGAIVELHREATALERRLLPGGATSLRSIAAAAQGWPKSSADGGTPLGRAWLRAACYEARARREVQRAAWRVEA
jgi:hypothetical protein